jgi:hypothetical protein
MKKVWAKVVVIATALVSLILAGGAGFTWR